jgi:hypothetical protein
MRLMGTGPRILSSAAQVYHYHTHILAYVFALDPRVKVLNLQTNVTRISDSNLLSPKLPFISVFGFMLVQGTCAVNTTEVY